MDVFSVGLRLADAQGNLVASRLEAERAAREAERSQRDAEKEAAEARIRELEEQLRARG